MRRNVSNPAGDSQKKDTVHIPPDLHKKRLLTLIVLLTLSLTSTLHAASITGKVTRVIDGDTIVVQVDDGSRSNVQGSKLLESEKRGEFRVRLAEIDAPESKQPYGREASEALSEMILGKTVVVEYRKRDRYGRVIGQVFLNRSTQRAQRSVNAVLVGEGIAWHYKQYSKSKELGQAQSKATDKKLGLWVVNNPLPPWQFRKQHVHKKKVPVSLGAYSESRLSAPTTR